MARKSLLLLGAALGVVLGACPLEPPDFWGRYWCFTVEGAFGLDPETGDVTGIHSEGHPIQTCFCFCDQLHADTVLFTGDDPPDPSDNWLEVIENDRHFAVERCQDAADALGLVDDNCEEATPQYPSWEAQDRMCGGGFSEFSGYCRDPGADGETGGMGSTEDTGSNPEPQ